MPLHRGISVVKTWWKDCAEVGDYAIGILPQDSSQSRTDVHSKP
jgi:hypothetical protein